MYPYSQLVFFGIIGKNPAAGVPLMIIQIEQSDQRTPPRSRSIFDSNGFSAMIIQNEQWTPPRWRSISNTYGEITWFKMERHLNYQSKLLSNMEFFYN